MTSAWRKSSASNPNGNCVELSRSGGGDVLMRNSRDPDGRPLVLTPEEMALFLAEVRSGAYDAIARVERAATPGQEPSTVTPYRVASPPRPSS